MTPVACALCTNEFGRYAIPLSSAYRPAAQTVLRGDVWERETIDLLRTHGDRGVVHAGTYFGDFLPGLSAALKPGRTIYAFEPNAENFACAEWTLSRLGHTRVEFLRRLPLAIRRALPGGRELLVVHATPWHDREIVHPDAPVEVAHKAAPGAQLARNAHQLGVLWIQADQGERAPRLGV